MLKNFTCIFCLLFFSASTFSQGFFELNSSWGIPMQGYRNKTTANHFGISSNFMLPFKQEYPNYQFGLNASYHIYGYAWEDVNFDLDILDDGAVIDQVNVPLEIISNHHMVGLHAVIYVEGKIGNAVTYVRGLVGGRRMWSYSNVHDRSDPLFFDSYQDEEDELIFSYEVERSYLFSFGGGVGVKKFLNKDQTLALSMGATYLMGTSASFYDRRDTQNWEVLVSESDYYGWDLFQEDLEIVNPVRRARPNLLFLEIGLEFFIDLGLEEDY